MIINIKQNTKEWREWRNKGLGASDAPIVMEVSPWTTLFQLWCYKTNALPKPEFNAFQVKAMERGIELEPIARKMYENILGKSFPSTSFEYGPYPFLRASLDGYNEELNLNVEIKCPGKVDHQTALKGKVPLKYYPQIQMQMLVSGATQTDYVSWDGKSDTLCIIRVLQDTNYQTNLLNKMIQFWSNVSSLTPPKVTSLELLDLFSSVEKSLENTNRLFNMFKVVFNYLNNKDGLIKIS